MSFVAHIHKCKSFLSIDARGIYIYINYFINSVLNVGVSIIVSLLNSLLKYRSNLRSYCPLGSNIVVNSCLFSKMFKCYVYLM